MKDYPCYLVTYQLDSDYDSETDVNIRFRYVEANTREQLLQILELLENSRAVYIDIAYFSGSKLRRSNR